MGHLPDEQNGFRKNRSCNDHVYVISSIVRNRNKNKENTFAAFIDLAKAFDVVPRELLLYKLLLNNADGKSIYTGTESQVRVNGLHTDFFDVATAVRHGDVLSPLLFNFYTSDLITELNNCNCGININNVNICSLCYADDLVLMSETPEGLQKMVKCVERWCKKWRMNVNFEKSKIVHFRGKPVRRSNFMFQFGQSNFEYVCKYKYLGILLDEFMDFNSCASHLADSASRVLGAVIAKFRQFRNVGFKTFDKLYKAMVVPVMDYGSEVWGFKEFEQCSRIQNRATCFYLGVHNRAPPPIAALQGNIGWILPKYRRYVNMLRLWNRFLTLDKTRITKHVFDWEYGLQCSDSWSDNVRSILNLIGLNNHYNIRLMVDLNVATTLLINKMEDEWRVNVSLKPKLRSYIIFTHLVKKSIWPVYARELNDHSFLN